MYIKPQILSFNYQDIVEIFGSAQTQYGYVDIGGGVYEARLNRQVVERRIEIASLEIKLPQTSIKTFNKTTA